MSLTNTKDFELITKRSKITANFIFFHPDAGEPNQPHRWKVTFITSKKQQATDGVEMVTLITTFFFPGELKRGEVLTFIDQLEAGLVE